MVSCCIAGAVLLAVVDCAHRMQLTNREIQDMTGTNPNPETSAAAAATTGDSHDTEVISEATALAADSTLVDSRGLSVSSNYLLQSDDQGPISELPSRGHSCSVHKTGLCTEKDSAGASNLDDSNNGKTDTSIFEDISFPYNCLPWYYKQRLVFELNAVRRRLQYLVVVDGRSMRFDCTLKPSLIQSTPYHGSFMSKTCTLSVLPGNLPKRNQDQYFHKIFLRKRFTRSPNSSGNENPKGKSFVIPGRSSSLMNLLSFSYIVKPSTGMTPTILPSNSLGTQVSSSSSSSPSSQNSKHLRLTKGSNSSADNVDYKERNISLKTTTSSMSKKTKTSANTGPYEWFVRLNAPQQQNPHPTYCSMEIIHFNAETGTFHREEIAYPYQPLLHDNKYGGERASSSSKSSRRLSIFSSFLISLGKWKKRDPANDETDATRMVRKRMARRLIVHTKSAKNIEKRTVIYQ